MKAHWTDDQLLDHLYGVGPGDGHLAECAVCRARWDVLSARRSGFVAAERSLGEQVPEAFFDQQRRSILRRAEAGPVRSWAYLRYGSALAGAAAVVFGVFLLQPVPMPPTPPVPGDQQLMADVSALIESPVPTAVAPISGLFEEGEEN